VRSEAGRQRWHLDGARASSTDRLTVVCQLVMERYNSYKAIDCCFLTLSRVVLLDVVKFLLSEAVFLKLEAKAGLGRSILLFLLNLAYLVATT